MLVIYAVYYGGDSSFRPVGSYRLELRKILSYSVKHCLGAALGSELVVL